MKQDTFSLLLGLLLILLCVCACEPLRSSTAQSVPATRTVQPTPLVGTPDHPYWVEDRYAGSCVIWHVSIDGKQPVRGCTALMTGKRSGDYILFSRFIQELLVVDEYQITAIDEGARTVSVVTIQLAFAELGPLGKNLHLTCTGETTCILAWGTQGVPNPDA